MNLPALLQHCKHYQDQRIVIIFIFGIASGFPWVMIGSALSAWLQEAGLSRSAIGLFGFMFTAYSVNFLWSPILDKVRIGLPAISRLGLRRSWIFTTQITIALACVAMANTAVATDLFYVATIGLVIAISSATQDIAIDGYRVDIIGADEHASLSAAAAAATAGWWTGFGGLGAIPFYIADLPGWGWANSYYILSAVMLTLSLGVLFAKEPRLNRRALQPQASVTAGTVAKPNWLTTLKAQLFNGVVAPFQEFFQRNGWRVALSILLFIFLFKMGEAFLGRMSIVFYKEIGFSNSDIGTYSKLFNWWVTIVCAALGGLMNMRYGIFKGLLISGIAMAASNLMFAALAIVGPDKGLFTVAIIVDGFTGAWSSVAMVGFISLMCNRAFSATQYALMASLGVLGRTLLASASGFIVDLMDGNWFGFFVLTSLMVVPSLLFLWRIRRHIDSIEPKHSS